MHDGDVLDPRCRHRLPHFAIMPSFPPREETGSTIRMPRDDGERHDQHDEPEREEDLEHHHLLLQGRDVSRDEFADETVITPTPIVVPGPDGRGGDGRRSLLDGRVGEDEDVGIHLSKSDLEVVLHERERVLQCVDFGSDQTPDEFLHRGRQDRVPEDGVDDVLDVRVEGLDGVVQRDDGPVHPSKDTVVDPGLQSCDVVVDLRCVERGLSLHVTVDLSGDLGGESIDLRSDDGRVVTLNRCDSDELRLDREHTEQSNEETSERRWGEDVVQGESQIDRLLRSQSEQPREFLRQGRGQRVLQRR